ncbi:CRISPR-associated helicase Cas3' [Enterococcus cecorum]|uniref:CRISPR-associated helicase Cas3' n=2 Tax=Enterococcus cecorum TaxID=44008 RepID=UPI00148DF7B0|nr:CRISPR-associated helicase Cas3' [Enterococcus cecorum]MCJ0571173.1 CRISPR-associated helicase Cas3' [Enterococcus cecorum]MDZ5560797.1 CRISPR-associated helicase Cas3' [Enterococcus cecorum]MDZ5575587.1 CRISPR-associated helicase Cas3' [Enterococcus cecorum]
MGIQKVIAHVDGDKEQLLDEHLFNVADEASKNAKNLHQEHILFMLGLFHDLGKSSRNFQEKLLNNPGKHVDHSTAGAYYLFNRIDVEISNEKILQKLLFKEICAYVISAHHGYYDIPFVDGPNCNEYYFSHLHRRMKEFIKNNELVYNEDILSFVNHMDSVLKENTVYDGISQLIKLAYEDFLKMMSKIDLILLATKSKDLSEYVFYCGLLERLYLSHLKNADILDTINAYGIRLSPMAINQKKQLKDLYINQIENLYEEYKNPTSEINKVRTELAEKILFRGDNDSTGIYRLNLPTGSGKTKLSMRYAFHQMKNGKNRFIYITPFLSVLEQNAFEIKKIIKGENRIEEEDSLFGIIEHHSNMVCETETDDDDKKVLYRSYLQETWDSNVVNSTMVQFFQTIFKVQSSCVRRFANLSKSVIILDEVQSLPVSVTSLFNLALNFLKFVMDTTVILCTATQPKYDLDILKHRLSYGDFNGCETDLIQMDSRQSVVFKRTTCLKLNEVLNQKNMEFTSSDELAEFVVKNSDKSILIILNTKKAVKHLYEEIMSKVSGIPIYHLSTSMCPKHRLDIVKNMKKRLDIRDPIICVSTQLIEAGVDIDFQMVIRSYAGIDSIVQAAGRCNREGKYECGEVYLVNLPIKEENLTRLPDLHKKKETASEILKLQTNPILLADLNDQFFEYYFNDNKPSDFDYPLGKDSPSVFDLLSCTKREKNILYQSFKKASDRFNLIQNDTFGIIVYYQESSQLIQQLYSLIDQYETTYDSNLYVSIKKLLKKLQPYTVNVYKDSSLISLTSKYLNQSILVLPDNYYSLDRGIVDDAVDIIL